MVSFHPHHFDPVFRIGEIADITEKLPVLLGQAAEVQVGKNIAQQNQPFELERLQKVQRVSRAAYIGAQVQIREYDGLKTVSLHALYL
jgi:hypothetical protein